MAICWGLVDNWCIDVRTACHPWPDFEGKWNTCFFLAPKNELCHGTCRKHTIFLHLIRLNLQTPTEVHWTQTPFNKHVCLYHSQARLKRVQSCPLGEISKKLRMLSMVELAQHGPFRVGKRLKGSTNHSEIQSSILRKLSQLWAKYVCCYSQNFPTKQMMFK